MGVPATSGLYTITVEGVFEGKDSPNYEAILPEGMHLAGEFIHTVLGVTQKDLLSRLASGLEECDSGCKG